MASSNITPKNQHTPAVAELLEQLQKPGGRKDGGRLIIGLDATMSRESTWDRACQIQGEMFEATAGLGGLEIQLVFYRGFNECKASRWVTTPADLHRLMGRVQCQGGNTQIARILQRTLDENSRHVIGALVFIGDAMEEEADALCHLAGELGQRRVPCFMFHEDLGAPGVAQVFKQIAELSGGAYATFDLASAERLKHLLGAVAAYAAGGRAALENYSKDKGEILRLGSQKN
jgi:hypothetical protein